jgi:hypothetical protein
VGNYVRRERVLFIGTQFSILYTSMYSPAEAATGERESGRAGGAESERGGRENIPSAKPFVTNVHFLKNKKP